MKDLKDSPKNSCNNAAIMHIIIQDVLQQDKNHIKIIQYTHLKTTEKQRSEFNCDSIWPNHIE